MSKTNNNNVKNIDFAEIAKDFESFVEVVKKEKNGLMRNEIPFLKNIQEALLKLSEKDSSIIKKFKHIDIEDGDQGIETSIYSVLKSLLNTQGGLQSFAPLEATQFNDGEITNQSYIGARLNKILLKTVKNPFLPVEGKDEEKGELYKKLCKHSKTLLEYLESHEHDVYAHHAKDKGLELIFTDNDYAEKLYNDLKEIDQDFKFYSHFKNGTITIKEGDNFRDKGVYNATGNKVAINSTKGVVNYLLENLNQDKVEGYHKNPGRLYFTDKNNKHTSTLSYDDYDTNLDVTHHVESSPLVGDNNNNNNVTDYIDFI